MAIKFYNFSQVLRLTGNELLQKSTPRFLGELEEHEPVLMGDESSIQVDSEQPTFVYDIYETYKQFLVITRAFKERAG